MYALDIARIATPIGFISVTGDEAAIHSVRIDADKAAEHDGEAPAVRAAIEQLRAWFAGNRRDFDLPLAPAASLRGAALRVGMAAIPYGETMSYGGLAKALGSGPRAIGQACARNPFPIIVPCHRVLGAKGVLGHYSAGAGPDTKSWLLDFERRHLEGST